MAKKNKRGHTSPDQKRLVKRASEIGFSIVERNGKLIVTPPDSIRDTLPANLKQYIAHVGEKALHPIRRYIKNQCGVASFK